MRPAVRRSKRTAPKYRIPKWLADKYRASGLEQCYVCREWRPEHEMVDLEFLGEEFLRQMCCPRHME